MIIYYNYCYFCCCQDCKNLIKGMLMIDPSKRFDINEILNHRWLKTVESDDTASENGFPIGETKNLKEFRNLISKIENMLVAVQFNQIICLTSFCLFYYFIFSLFQIY